ncbi:hypothetical protein [Rhizobium sp. AG855]|uniref:hypothetical protein n=1 Tax=Rhizobium sp. AG855 TaxID=2183898 RepID=UPI000E751A57|nr:hypothetical protein [Rhizobium sp. AG855]RKE85137.1 hypothetical protein DFO46_1928 [Rhizobium sp. AG855]
MADKFIEKILHEHSEVKSVSWLSENVVEIARKKYAPFQAAILKVKLVETEHIAPYLNSEVSLIVNFPKAGRWTGAAIELCESHGKAWGQWGVLMRAINSDSPETTENPEIAFSIRALRQHSRVLAVNFLSDHLLLVHHKNGERLRVALVYEYDLTGDDVRNAWDKLGQFDILLKTNPNGVILPEAREVSERLEAKVFEIGDTLGYLARGKF